MGNQQNKVTKESSSQAFDPDLVAAYQAVSDATHSAADINVHEFQKLFTTHPKIGSDVFQYMEPNGTQTDKPIKLQKDVFLAASQEILEISSQTEHLKLYIAILCGNTDPLSRNDICQLLERLYQFEWSRLRCCPDLSTNEESNLPIMKTLLGSQDVLQFESLCSRLGQHLPNIFNLVHTYICAALRGSDRHKQSRQNDASSQPEVLQKSNILSPWLLWSLSCCLGNTFIPLSLSGAAGSTSALSRLVDNNTWHCLYNSDRDGLSPNRFSHHALAYPGPTILLLIFEGHSYCVAVDQEWRDSPDSWGTSQCQIIQLKPQWCEVTTGSPPIYFNLSARNAPKYLAIGRNPAIFIVDCHFEKVKLHGMEYKLQAMEVWGCGGTRVLEAQRDQKSWEKQEADKAKNRKLKLDDWKDNPDRQILNMGGVTTEHAEQ